MSHLFCRTMPGLLMVLAACRDGGAADDRDGIKFCDAYADVAKEVGCNPELDCSIAPDCEDLAHAWLACARKDLSQCMCETSGKVNCEGSFKPSEGRALCIDEYRALDVCLESEDE